MFMMNIRNIKKCMKMKLEIHSLRLQNISMSNIYKENEFYNGQILLFNELSDELKKSKEFGFQF